MQRRVRDLSFSAVAVLLTAMFETASAQQKAAPPEPAQSKPAAFDAEQVRACGVADDAWHAIYEAAQTDHFEDLYLPFDKREVAPPTEEKLPRDWYVRLRGRDSGTKPTGRPPAPSLVQKWRTSSPRNIFDCPGLAEKRSITPLTPPPIEYGFIRTGNGTFLSLQLPVISADGRNALFYVGGYGSYREAGFFVHMLKADGRWRVVGMAEGPSPPLL
jgi:hypothetical protein